MAATPESISLKAYENTTNSTVAKPAGSAQDDVLLASLFIFDGDTEAEVTPPAGFEVAEGDWPIPIIAPEKSRQVLYAKALGASEPDDYTWSHEARPTSLALMRISAADLDSVYDATPTANQGTGSTRTWLSIETATADALIVAFGWDYASTSNDLTAPAGTTPVFTEQADGVTLVIYTGTLAAPGATGDKTQTNNGSPWSAGLVAIRSLAPPAFDVSLLTTGDGAASSSIGGDISDTTIGTKPARANGSVSPSLPESGLWPASISRDIADPGGTLYRCLGLRNNEPVKTLSVTWFVKRQLANQADIKIGLAPESPGSPVEEIADESTAPTDVDFVDVEDEETAIGPFLIAPGDWQGLWHALIVPADATSDLTGHGWACRFVAVEAE